MCAALDIEPIITLAYDLNDPLDWADLVEYCFGDESTAWGKRRIADGHPEVYNVSVFELGTSRRLNLLLLQSMWHMPRMWLCSTLMSRSVRRRSPRCTRSPSKPVTSLQSSFHQ